MKTLLLLFIFSVSAQAQNWSINKDHSEILFEIPYLKVSEVTGRFTKFEGSIDYDEKTKTFKALSMSIEAQSIDTGNKMRDGHLRSNDFLKTSLYPNIIFKSNNITRLKPNNFRASGTLTIRNISRPTSFEFLTTDMIQDTWGFKNIFVKFKSEINRQDFQMVWNKTLPQSEYLVGDVVTVFGNLQLQPLGEKTPTTKHMIPDNQTMRDREKVLRGEARSNSESLTTTSINNEQTIIPKPIEEIAPIIKTISIERSFTWWIAFAVLGLLGFLASITMGTKAKQYIASTYHAKYVESGILGNLTDLIVVVIVLIYAMAFWYVGWGH